MSQYPVTFIYLLTYRLRHGKMSTFFCDDGLKLMDSDKIGCRHRKSRLFFCDDTEKQYDETECEHRIPDFMG